jgi:hypothetical protein
MPCSRSSTSVCTARLRRLCSVLLIFVYASTWQTVNRSNGGRTGGYANGADAMVVALSALSLTHRTLPEALRRSRDDMSVSGSSSLSLSSCAWAVCCTPPGTIEPSWCGNNGVSGASTLRSLEPRAQTLPPRTLPETLRRCRASPEHLRHDNKLVSGSSSLSITSCAWTVCCTPPGTIEPSWCGNNGVSGTLTLCPLEPHTLPEHLRHGRDDMLASGALSLSLSSCIMAIYGAVPLYICIIFIIIMCPCWTVQVISSHFATMIWTAGIQM